MKKLIIAIGLITVAVVSSHAQGTVVFGNGNTTRVSTNSVVGGAGTAFVAANATQGFYYALFATTTLTSSTASAAVGTQGVYAFNSGGSWAFAGVYGTNSAAGRLAPSSPNADGSASASNIVPGAAGFFTVIGWSANIGTTWQAVQAYLLNPTVAGWVGQSVVSGSLNTGISGSTPAIGLWGAAAPNIQGFTLGLVTPVAPVPEPGTMALAALGGASLLLFRRKNK
jgi:hypothetical protein